MDDYANGLEEKAGRILQTIGVCPPVPCPPRNDNHRGTRDGDVDPIGVSRP